MTTSHPSPVTHVELPDVPPEEAAFFSPHFDGRRFFNPWRRRVASVARDGDGERAHGLRELLRWKLDANPFAEAKRAPSAAPAVDAPLRALQALPADARAVWLGHASVYVELDGARLAIDPVFGRVGPVRRSAPLPLDAAALPPVDAVLITHGHYDHLDVRSVRALRDRAGGRLRVVTPLGLGRYLPSGWDVTELDWWQAVRVGDVECCLVPAQHWHRRSLSDGNRALWGGYVVRGSRSLYHSGDTGYFGGFRSIGRVFPGLDLAVLPLGAFEPRWFMGGHHMAPEQTLDAFAALGARQMLGMHWGTYDLTDEPLDHGARALFPRIVSERGLDERPLHVTAIGGAVALDDSDRSVGDLAPAE
ncbi:MAG: MBL fold metallo-hydrolase [Myxococcales bacterium]|nr:MBL fold metallo-hydrolase [Myxococcales bacterium]